MHGNAVVVDLREDEVIHPTNRFMVYALHPECNLSIHVLWGLKRQNTVLAMGKSIIDRSSRTNVGALMLGYGGGGHDAAGTCQVATTRRSRCSTSSSSASTPTADVSAGGCELSRRTARRRRGSGASRQVLRSGALSSPGSRRR